MIVSANMCVLSDILCLESSVSNTHKFRHRKCLETRAVLQSLRKRLTMTEKENLKIKTVNRAVN